MVESGWKKAEKIVSGCLVRPAGVVIEYQKVLILCTYTSTCMYTRGDCAFGESSASLANAYNHPSDAPLPIKHNHHSCRLEVLIISFKHEL